MPTSSAISSDDKTKIKAAIPSSSNKILTAAVARIYYAYPDPNKWSYSGLQGALALSKDNNRGAHVFKLVDLVGTGGIVWEHELYEGFEYNQDRPFFYSFPGDVSSSSSSKRLCVEGCTFIHLRDLRAHAEQRTQIPLVSKLMRFCLSLICINILTFFGRNA
jgi:hypothetical protein